MDTINQQYCLTHSSGEDIYLFTLSNAKGTEVIITNYGAIITSFKVKQADGSINDIVLGFDTVQEYLSDAYLADYPYFGAAIGRYANRIKQGRFIIDDITYQVAKNKVTDHLHGGESGFDKKVWTVVSFSALPEPNLVLAYKSADGEEGYPGQLDVTIKFSLNDNNELSYEYSARTDKATAVNLTHHSYFNLEKEKNTIGKHLVSIASSEILEQDDNFVVTGNTLAVEGTIYDFLQPKRIDTNWHAADGYDQSFVIDKANNSIAVAQAYAASSGITLQVFTTEPLVHFYTGKWNPVIKGKNNTQYGPFSGFCFETQKHPNAINIAAFPNTVLRPGENYYTKTVYRVTAG